MAKKNAGTKPKRGNRAIPEALGAGAAQSPMNLSLLEQLTKLMRENDLNVIEVRDGDKRISVKRGGQSFVSTPTFSPTPSTTPAVATGSADAGKAAEANVEANLVPIKSPMVGTFYSASSPDAKPFVSVGSTVDDDTDICVIEAMKVFNNIKAETHGTIAKVLVTNGATVEFGQILFLVKP